MIAFSTFSRYVGRQFLQWFISLMLVLAGVILLFEFVELLRRTANRPEVTVTLALEMSVLKLPQTVEVLFHFAVLFSAMFTFWRLTRSQELVVARATGVSAWQFLLPVLLLAAAIGLFKITVFNPLSAFMFARFADLEEHYIKGQSDVLNISRGGLWLRQRDAGGISVIHADNTEPHDIRLNKVMILLYDANEHFRGRIDAESAALRGGYWDLRGAWIRLGTRQPDFAEQYRLPTDLTPDRIQESFASPKMLGFWALPDFIATLDATGFSSLKYRLHYESLLAQPLLLAGMVLFAAAFSLRHTRRGGTLMMVLLGVLTGFMLFVVSDIVMALGLAESIPVVMAAWAPAGVGLLIGTATLLHLEDG